MPDLTAQPDPLNDLANPLSDLIALDGAPVRHDGWTPERMAQFCEHLAECVIVRDACARVGMGVTAAYAARRRVPLFAAAWEDALGHARDCLADALLERALTGSVESFYRDGVLVGERRTLDNKLAIALLKRLDRREAAAKAELASANQAARNARTAQGRAQLQQMLTALRTGDEDDLARAVALIDARDDGAEANEANEANEVNSPWYQVQGSPSDRIWYDSERVTWLTDFAPPPGFKGKENGSPLEDDYVRECSPEEAALLERWRVEQLSPLWADRERYFGELEQQLAA